ncbi:sensor histidine kinase N-terminal domain-containing protein [Candidatus Sumerlaeota bacterium]|nr:sensor histidine kinase N-terminal domain-containing protein [Candidatus Sumerlaeota bacterium]
MRSLRLRLLALFMVMEIAVIFAMAALVYHRSERALFDAMDADLASSFHGLATELEEGEPVLEVTSELSEGQRAEFGQGRDHFYQIADGAGHVLVTSPSLHGDHISLPEDWEDDLQIGEVVHTLEEWDDEEIRVATLAVSPVYPVGFDLNDADPGRVSIVQIAAETDDLRDTLRDLVDYLTMIGGGLILLSLLGGYALSSWALRPVRRLGDQVAQITEETLDQRLPEGGLPAELRPLSEGFNRSLSRLEAAFERERRFLADASHELRTPVSVAMSIQEVALRHPREPARYVEAIETSLQASLRMKSLVERMMAVAREDRRQTTLNWIDTDLGEAVDAVVQFLGPLAERCEVAIRWRRPEAPVRFRGDRMRLEELVENLVSNGIIHNRPGGEVRIELLAGENGRGHELRVSDDGPGIAPEHIPHLFERFYRVDRARAREHGGSGLGLSIAQWVAESHGATIEVKSQLGEGAEFRVLFPA